MKKIITTVGTSIFTNLIKSNGSDVKEHYEFLKDADYSKWDDEEDSINSLRKAVNEGLNGKADDSAEIKSILAIANDLKEDVDVYLLATDTVLSRLACELVKAWFEKYWDKSPEITINFNPKLDVISGLQIKDKKAFESLGLVNLVNRFDSICAGNYSDVLLNITGGFKATIPYLTIFAQVNKIHLKYIFEDTDTVIDIPPVPLTVDNTLFEEEKYQKEFALLKTEILKQSDYWQFCQDAKSCLQLEPTGEIFLSSLGSVLWDKYEKQFFSFYCPDDVWVEIEKQKNILRILSDSFSIEEQRTHHNNPEQSHKTVFKMYGSDYRIYYFYDQNKVYIYKTFEDHNAHMKYIGGVKFTDKFKEDIIRNVKLRLIKKV